ncbi:MAG TPA: type VII secretion protein EccB [Mycobacterium sp.]|nr:type VII secretion protein EccB [Mycobacterium sp.]
MTRRSTKMHVSGYRFLLRRMEHALVRGDVRMLDDPLRAQSLSFSAGAVLAVIAVAVCAVLAFLRPPGVLGSAPIVMVRDSGALYVRIGDVVHPVLNLASARMIAGTSVNPEVVSATAINNAKRGPLVGIPGAPAEIPTPLGSDETTWAVCDDNTSTAVIAGDLRADGVTNGLGVLVTAHSESAAATYLLYDGWRAEVDLRNRAVVRALKLDGVVPRPVSRVLLDATPEAPPIAAPHIPDAGSPGPLRGFPIGSVVRVDRAAAEEYYVVLAQGMQRIGQVAADLIRFTNSQNNRDIATAAPDTAAAVPIVDSLRVSSFPERGGVSNDGIVCTRWNVDAAAANTSVVVMNSLSHVNMMALAQADGDGPNIDSFAIPRGRSAYVRAIGVGGDGASTGTLYFVNDSGVAFGLRDEDTAQHLGLAGPPASAPWPVLARLPRGPELSKDAASVARDSIGGTS